MASLSDRLPIYGGADDDALSGGANADIIHGDAGDDTLIGGGGADTLVGGVGNDLLFGGAGANVLFGGAGDDIMTYNSADADGALQRLFGGDGANALVLEFSQDDYLQPGVIDEVLGYANALSAGENPGNGGEFVFQSFALRAANFSNILIFVDGDPIAPGEVPGVDAVDDAFTVTENGSAIGDVTLNDNVPAGAVVSLLTDTAGGELTLQSDGTFSFDTSGAFEDLSVGDTTTVGFTYRLSDGDDQSDATVVITITGANDAPTAGAATGATDENDIINGDLIADSGAADVDRNDVLSVISVNGQALGDAARQIALPSGAVITVTPAGGYAYDPGAAFDALASGDTATEVISFVLADEQGGQVASTLTLTINGANDAPQAIADIAATTEETPVTFDVVGNDTDIDQGDTLTLVSIDAITGGGTATITPTGQILFDPQNDFQDLSAGANAFVEIEYTVEDAAGASSSATATVTVTGVNDAPTATDINDATTEDLEIAGNLLTEAAASDIDSADVLTISAIDGVAFTGGFSAPIASGAVLTVLANGDYTYSPTAGFNGLGVGETATDAFTFTITDGRGGEVTQTFSVEITGENDAPVVRDFATGVDENDTIAVDFLTESGAFDPDDNGVLTLTAINGTQLDLQSPITSNLSTSGSTGGTRGQTTGGASGQVTGGSGLGQLAIIAPALQGPRFDGSNGGQLILGVGNDFTFDTLRDFEELSVGDVATTTFTFTVQDDQGAAVTRTLTVEVQGTNDDPTADPVEFLTDEDTAATGNLLSASGAADIDQNDTLTVTEVLSDGLIDGALNGAQRTFTFSSGAVLTVAPDGAFTFLPAPADQALAQGERNTEDFAFRISDGQGGETLVTVGAFVDGLNDDPTADAINRGALEDDTVFGDLLTDSNAADIDNGDVLFISQVDGQLVDTGGVTFTGADGGTLFVNTSGGYTFNPNGDFEFLSVGDTATSSFDFRIADSFGGFVDQTITFEVAGANDAPTVNAITASTDEDTALVGDFLSDSGAADIDQNDTLVVTEILADGLNNGALNGATQVFTLNSGAELTVSPDGSFTYDPGQAFQTLAEGESAEEFLSFRVSDGNGGLATESLTITIGGVNDAPTLDPIAVTVGENSSTPGNLVDDSNAADVDAGDFVTIFAVEGQDFSFGTVTISRPGDGRFTAESADYTYETLGDFDFLSVGDTATSSYEFTVTDSFGATTSSTITFTIEGANDGPTADDVAQSTTEDDVLTRNLLSDSNADDIDQNDTLTISRFTLDGVGVFDLSGGPVTQALSNGALLTVNADGGYEVDPAGNFDALAPGDTSEASFEFTISDGNGGEIARNAVITVTGVNDAPVAVDDTATTDQNTSVPLDILSNDFDVDNDFTLTSFTQPDNGGLVISVQGLAFLPNEDFIFLGLGEETTTTFTYTITDDFGATDTADVVITVKGLNDAPEVTPLTATTDEDRAAFTFDLLTDQVDFDQNDVLSVENFTEVGTTFGDFTISGATFTFDARQFDPLDDGDSQIITYTYDVVDTEGARVTNTLTLTVEGRDEGITAIDDEFGTDEDAPISGDVSLNDTLGAGAISLVEDVKDGVLSLAADGTFTFDPNGDFDALADGDFDSVFFTYVIDDGTQSSTATATIAIFGVNDGPEASDVALNTDEDTPLTVNLIDASNAADPDASGPIELNSLDGVFLPFNNDDETIVLASGATVVASRDGEITFDPVGFFDQLSNGELDIESFTFELIDDFGDTLSVTADIDILGVNDPVEADDSSFTADEDDGASDNLIGLSNVFDPDLNDDILISDVDGTDPTGTVTITLGSGALLTVDEFGEFFYDTNGQFEGLAEGETADDSFTYTITDGLSSIDLTSTITVEGANDAPVIDVAASTLADTFTDTGAGGGAASIAVGDLDGSNGFALVGQDSFIYSGYAVAGGGDVNGDGFDDLIVGNPGFQYYASTDGGSAFLLFGDGAATAPASRTIPAITPATSGLSLIGDSGEYTGRDASFVGDVNGDGFDDFLIGNGQSDSNGVASGVARLVFGRDFTGLTGNEYLTDPGASVEFFDSGAGFYGSRNLGASVASAGDVNNDGITDFIIGAPYSSLTNVNDFGKAFVVFGRSATDPAFGNSFDLATLDGTNGFRIDNGYSDSGTLLGAGVAGIGDVNGDGIDDIIVGAPGKTEEVFTPPDDLQTFNTGASYVIFGSGSAFGDSINVEALAPSDGFKITDSVSDSYLGGEVAGVGDFNGDGLDDYVVSARYYENTGGRGGYQLGAVFVIYGNDTQPPGELDLASLTPAQGFKIVGESGRSSFTGEALAAAGDFNGDGFDDILIGADNDYDGAAAGEAFVLFGTDQLFASPFSLGDFDANDGVRLLGGERGDLFGARVSGAGDLNEDGFDDVIVGAPGAGASNPGAAYIFFGAAGGGGGGVSGIGGTGSVFFDDVDLTDIHTVSDDFIDDDVTFDFDLVTDSTGGVTGEAVWTAVIDQDAFDMLADGQTEVATANVTISDAFGGSATEEVVVTFLGINDAPTAEAATRTTDEDTALTDGDLFTEGNIMDVDDGDALRIASITINVDSGTQTFDLSASQTTTTIRGATLTIDETGAYSFDPTGVFDDLDVGDTTPVSFTYVVEDLAGATVEALATINITGINDAPTATDDTATTDQDTAALISVFDNDIDPEGGLTITALDDSLTAGTIVLESADLGTVSYNPNGAFDFLDDGEQATDTFAYTLEDTGGLSATATVAVTVTGLNDAPVARDSEREISENDTIAGSFISESNSFDPDTSDTLVVQSVDGTAITGANQTVVLASGSTLLISPNGDYTYNPLTGSLQTLPQGGSADEAISIVLSDGDLTATSSLLISVTGVNDAPTATPLARTTNEDEAAFDIDLLANAVDIDQGDVLSVENVAEDGTAFGSFTLAGSTLTYDATIFDDLDAGETEVINFTYDVVDSRGARVATTLALTIEGRDEALLAVDDAFSIDEDSLLIDDVSLNDTDQGGVYSLVTSPTGDITFDADGSFTYDPTLAFSFLGEGDQVDDTFTYQIDNGTDQVTAEVTITIDGINDAPAIFIPTLSDVRLVSEDVTDTAGGNNASLFAAISGDGGTIVFDSRATDLVAGDTNVRTDVFFEDPTEAIDRANLQDFTNDQSTDDGATTAEVSADGKTIVFQSRANDLVNAIDGSPLPDNNQFDIFVRELDAPVGPGVTGDVTRLMIPFGTDGNRLNGDSINASVSANGRFVAFESTAFNITSDTDDNTSAVAGTSLADIFLHDRESGETRLISQRSDTAEVFASFRPTISADGGTVVFLTANSHAAADTNGEVDVYAYDVAADTLELISKSSAGVVGDQEAVSTFAEAPGSTPSVSANGRYVSWTSRATNLVDDDTNNADDIFVHDRVTGETERVSITFGGGESNGPSFETKLSDNGRFVTFQTVASNLDDLAPDTNSDNDIYVKDRITGDLIRVSITPDFVDQPGGRQPDISADGTMIAFSSQTIAGNFDDRVVTAAIDDIYVASVDTTGFNFSQNDTLAFVDLESQWFDEDGLGLDFSNITITSDDADRVVSFTEVLDGGRVVGVDLVASDFADLGVNDYELLTVEYDLTDGIANEFGVTAVVIVGENDAPTADAQTFQVNQGGSVTGAFIADDVDGDTFTFSFTASSLLGDLSLNDDGSFTYGAASNQTLDETISIDVTDENGGSTSFLATFEVNLAPIFTSPGEVLVALTDDVNPDPMNAIDAGAFFTDPEGGVLSFSAVTRGFTNLRNGLSIDAATGVITGTPTADDLVRIEVTATDENGNSTVGDFWLATVDEIVLGDADDNNIADGFNSSFIDALGGNDSITGDNNTDIYQYRRGDGFDIIDDTQSGGINRLVFTGFNSDEVQFSRFFANPFGDNGLDLLITPIGQPVDFTEGVLIREGLTPTAGASELSFYHFDDGVILDESVAMAQILASESTDGNDDIRGFRSFDTLAGGLGNDALSGGDGSDLYIFNAGDGDDTIRENGFVDNDIIQIGYNQADAAFSRLAGTNDVIIDFGGGDRLTVVNVLAAPNDDNIEVYRFLDGDLSATDVRNILIQGQATSGDDVIQGFSPNGDTLEGGPGNDSLYGFNGTDTYIYRAGDGDDLIHERGNAVNDVLEVFDFTIDYDLVEGRVNAGSQVTFQRGGSEGEPIFQDASVIINLDNGAGLTGSIEVVNGVGTGNADPLSEFIFDASGVTLTAEQIRSDLLRQQETEGDDVVVGFGSGDTLIGGLGNDLLLGGDGTDFYQFATGDGDDTVREIGFQEADTVVFTDRALADFDIFYDPNIPDNVIFTAGSDRIEIVNGLIGGNNNNISFFVFTDQTVAEADMRQIIVDLAVATPGRDIIGATGEQTFVSTPGEDRFLSGRAFGDSYTYAAGDGNDTIFDNSTTSATFADSIDLTAFNSTDFALAGPNSIRFDPAFNDNVQFFIDANNTLDIISFSQIEQVIFADATFDSDADDTDGATNFGDFITSLADEATAADPNEDVITKVTIEETGSANNIFTSTALNEAFLLDGSGNDQLFFNVSEIGDDSISKGFATVAGYGVTIDFSALGGNLVIEESVSLSISEFNQHDLIIDIVYEDIPNPFGGPGIGRVEERIELKTALQEFNDINTLKILDTQGRTVDLDGNVIDTDGVANTFNDTNELRQLFIDRAITAGDDIIPNYFAGGLTLRGGGGDDTLAGARGGQTFEFVRGDGRVTVAEVGQSGGGTDTVAIRGFAYSDATIRRAPDSTATLVFDFGSGDVLTIDNFYPGGFVIERFTFELDGQPIQEVTGDEIATEYLSQLATSGDDSIVGGDGRNETLDGGTGNDTLDGQDGSDTYIVRRGEGDKFVRETGTGDTDRLELNVASTSVTFEQNPIDPNNIIIVMDDGTRVEIFNFLEGNDGKIEEFVFSDSPLDGLGDPIPMTTEEARILAFDGLATTGDDNIVGGATDDTLRGGLGDDTLRGANGNDTFVYAIGDGDDLLTTTATNNEFEFIQISGVDVGDVIFSRVPGSRDLSSGQPSIDEDLLITFANDPGSIRIENGLRQASTLDRIEIVDSMATLTDEAIFNAVLANDILNGRTLLEGPSTGRAFFPAGAEFIFAQQQGDLFQFAAGQGTLTILDDAPASEIQRLEVLGYNSTDAAFSRLAAGSEDFIIRLPGGDQIIVIGDVSGVDPVNGVNEIFFAGDNIVFSNEDITTLIDGGSASGSSGGGSGGGSPRTTTTEAPDTEDVIIVDPPAPADGDTLVFTAANDAVRLGEGDDHARLRGGADMAWGQAGDDTILGGGGADTLRGGAGDDDLRGGGGRDRLIGGADDDILRGNGGRDTLKGGRGEDNLIGGYGRDTLKGGAGDDVIEGGRGNDRLMGQGGEDTFAFTRGFGRDVITDYRDGVDMLDFSAHNGVSAFGDLDIEQSGVNAVITDGLGGSIMLLRTDVNDLQEDDFLF